MAELLFFHEVEVEAHEIGPCHLVEEDDAEGQKVRHGEEGEERRTHAEVHGYGGSGTELERGKEVFFLFGNKALIGEAARHGGAGIGALQAGDEGQGGGAGQAEQGPHEGGQEFLSGAQGVHAFCGLHHAEGRHDAGHEGEGEEKSVARSASAPARKVNSSAILPKEPLSREKSRQRRAPGASAKAPEKKSMVSTRAA